MCAQLFRLRFTTLAGLICAVAWVAGAVDPCRIEIVEEGSGWPIPLVELRTTHQVAFVSDNAGIIAFDLPELMGRETWFEVRGNGYERDPDGFGYRGVRLTPEPGKTLQIELRRTHIARRLGRLTGAGRFAESQKTGQESGWREDGVSGCDSVQNAIYHDRMVWLWGDTTLAHYPLGVFDCTFATTPVRALPSFEPPLRLVFDYVRDAAGQPRGVAKMPGPGPTWLSGMVTLPDQKGQPHLVATYSKIRGYLEAYEWGLCGWNDATEGFDRIQLLWSKSEETPTPPPVPEGHPVIWKDEDGASWVLFGNPFPKLRCPATFEAWRDPMSWETLTPQATVPAAVDGRTVRPHTGSIAWNPWRKRWVALFMEAGGSPSAFGELWYAEADAPIGPWGPTVKVISHDNYTFYNPRLHPELTPDDSPILLFEGTYTAEFANHPTPTPRYNYNQILYRLDLDDPALAPAQRTAIDLRATEPGARPNIILYMADDLGWGDTGYNGHPVLQTPNLDDMAANGFVFHRFYAAAPICSPTRASVMSGRNPVRSKVTSHGRYMRSHLERMLPRALKSAGYVTGLFGKSHLGSGQPDSPVNPSGMGFDEWVIGLNFFDESPYLSRNGTVEHRPGEMGTVAVIDEAIAFLDAHKDRGKPMFTVVWVPSPHDPWDEASRDPAAPTFGGDGYFKEIYLLDEQLGRIRQWLRDTHLEQNTLLWVCSDNGGLRAASSGGRGKKNTVYEGGLRVPGLIEWPARHLKGSSNVPVVTSDIYPTLLALVGATVENPLPLDGVDIRNIIEGISTNRPAIGFWHNFQGGQSTWSDNILRDIMTKQHNGDPLPHNADRIKKDVDDFPQFPETSFQGHAAWLDWPWKLHRLDASTYELYNLEADPQESINRVNDPALAGRLNDMKSGLLAWQASCIRSLNGADYRPGS